MLIPFADVFARHTLQIRGVIHAGAHLGQEAAAYAACGVGHVLWVEANPALIPPLRKAVRRYDHRVAEACLGETTGVEVTFNLADSTDGSNRGQSSSVLPLGTHKIAHPEVTYRGSLQLLTSSLDDVMSQHWPAAWERPNMLNMDLQGYELHCLRGAVETLRDIDVIYTEVNEDQLYEGCAVLPDLVDYLADAGFVFVEKHLAGSQTRDLADGQRWVGWGDAVFIRAA